VYKIEGRDVLTRRRGMDLSLSPNPATRTSLQTLDPDINVLHIAPWSPVLGLSTGGLHLNGRDSASSDEGLVLARPNAGKELDAPLAVSPGAFDSALHEQIKLGSVGLVQDLQPYGVRPTHYCCVSSVVSADLDSGKVCSEGERTEHVLKADLVKQTCQKRIPASKKMKWGLDGSPGFQRVFNAPGDLNVCCDLSHRHGGIGGLVPRDMSHRPIQRSCVSKGKSGTSAVDDEGWSVVKPKFWWRKKFDSPESDLLKQQIEMNGTSFFRRKLSGKCFNCHASDHYAYLCSAPVRCWQCLQAGHRARSCPRKIYHGRAHSIRDLPGSLKHSLQRGSKFSSCYHSSNLTPVLFKRGRRCNLGKQPPLLLSSEGSPTSKLFREFRSWKLATPET
jgi:hypothetical protein